jgi:predicted ATPase with chaperone activity
MKTVEPFMVTPLTPPEGLGEFAPEARRPREFTPEAPTSLEETGLSEAQVIGLLLKTLFQQGGLLGDSLAEAVALPFVILDDLLLTMTQRRFVEVLGTSGHSRGGYQFELTDEGRNRAEAALAANRYVGPAPVPLDQFREWVRRQSVRDHRVSRDRLQATFDDLVLPSDVMDALGPAVNSGGSIFLHGAPGNGKTAIAERLGSLVSSEIYLPHALMIDGQIVVLFDPVYHERVEDPSEIPINGPSLVRADFSKDRRFVKVKRPTVFVGGELTMDQLDLQLNPYSKVYQAPFQLKAAGGVLIVDDFGRQRMGPAELLNRWIVPLEKGFDNLTLDTGVRFPVPFDCILIFATNLNPRDLVDEAFLRRIQFKVEVRSPTRKDFEQIFRINCDEAELEYDQEAVDYLFERFFDGYGITPRGCHPRDIIHHIRSIATFEEGEATFHPALLGRAAKAYFLVMEEEIQPGIASIPITMRYDHDG